MKQTGRTLAILLLISLWLAAPTAVTAGAPATGPVHAPVERPEQQADSPAWIIWETEAPVQRLALAGDSLWVGHAGAGLTHWDLETGPIRSFSSADGLPGQDVLDIKVDGSGDIWVALLDGSLARSADGAKLRGTLESIGGACGVAAAPGSLAKVAKVTAAPVCDPDLLVNILRSADEWDEAVIAGVNKLDNIDGDAFGRLLVDFKDSPELLQDSLRLVGRYDFTGWDSSTVSRLTNYISKAGGDDAVEFMLNKMLAGDVDNLFNVQFARMLDRLGNDDLLRTMLGNNVSDDIRNGLLSTIRRAEHPNTPPWAMHGANFQIHRGKHYFSSNQLISFEQSRLDLTLLTADGPIIEAKYWSRNRIFEDLTDPTRSTIVSQIRERVLSGRPIIVEFGSTVSEPPVTIETVNTVREVLKIAGINLDNVSFSIVDSHLFTAP